MKVIIVEGEQFWLIKYADISKNKYFCCQFDKSVFSREDVTRILDSKGIDYESTSR